MSLSACAANDEPAVKPVKTEIPAYLLEPVPAPPLPVAGAETDIDVGVLGLEDEKALEACNAKLEGIKKLNGNN